MKEKIVLKERYFLWDKVTRISSYFLTLSFLALLLISFFDLDFIKNDQGLWIVTENKPSTIKEIVWREELKNYLGVVSFFVMFLFIFATIRRMILRKKVGIILKPTPLQPSQATEYIAWFTFVASIAYLLIPSVENGSRFQESIWGEVIQLLDPLVILITALLYFRGNLRFMNWNTFKKPRANILQIVLGFMVFFLFIQPMLDFIVTNIFHLTSDSYRNDIISEWVRNAQAKGGFAISLKFLGIVILTPIAEEILCRGIIHRSVANRFGIWIGALVSALFFTALHVDPVAALPIFILSLFLSYLYERSKSIWAPILFHAINNGVYFLLILWLSV